MSEQVACELEGRGIDQDSREIQAIVGLAVEDLSFFPKGNIEEC